MVCSDGVSSCRVVSWLEAVGDVHAFVQRKNEKVELSEMCGGISSDFCAGRVLDWAHHSSIGSDSDSIG